jgi:hypothetical protein
MATVDKDSANWRLFGGGGLLVGGLLWLIAAIVGYAAPGPVGLWLGLIGLLVVGIALFFVAFGETGSNGAVGASGLGKVALVVFGAGWIILAISQLLGALSVSAPDIIAKIAAVFIIVGGVVSALVIYQRNVARGAARWVIFVPVVVGIVWAIAGPLGWVSFGSWWLGAVLAALFAVTGLLYLLNRKDVG